ncbi:hypothetical protein ACSS6W_004842 [Trichoderma asperelloides]
MENEESAGSGTAPPLALSTDVSETASLANMSGWASLQPSASGTNPSASLRRIQEPTSNRKSSSCDGC